MRAPSPGDDFNVLLTWLCILSGLVLVVVLGRMP